MEHKPIDPEHAKRIELGKAGRLFRMEILFYYHDNEVKRCELKNLTFEEIMEKRRDIFSSGFMYPVDPGHWIIISPGEIKVIDVWRQMGFIWEDFKK